MQAPLARITVPWIVAQPVSAVAHSAAGISSLAQYFVILPGLLMFGLEPPDTSLLANRKQPHHRHDDLNDRHQEF